MSHRKGKQGMLLQHFVNYHSTNTFPGVQHSIIPAFLPKSPPSPTQTTYPFRVKRHMGNFPLKTCFQSIADLRRPTQTSPRRSVRRQMPCTSCKERVTFSSFPGLVVRLLVIRKFRCFTNPKKGISFLSRSDSFFCSSSVARVKMSVSVCVRLRLINSLIGEDEDIKYSI